jgi:hypothetical protein
VGVEARRRGEPRWAGANDDGAVHPHRPRRHFCIYS